jgi:hypothetical protein
LLIDAASVIVADPSEKICGSVRLPNDVVVPHSNHPAEETPAGTRVPFKVAEFEVTAVASLVVADAVFACGYPVSTPSNRIHTSIPKHLVNLIVPPMVFLTD